MCARTAADIKAAADEVRAKTGVEVIDDGGGRHEERGRRAPRRSARRRRSAASTSSWRTRAGRRAATSTEMTDEQWYGAFETTVMFVVRLIRGVLPSMKRKKWGRILTIQSVSVKQPVPGAPALECRAAGRGRHGEDALRRARQAQHHHQRRVPRQDPHRPSARRRQAGGHSARTSSSQKAGRRRPARARRARRRSSPTSWCSSHPSARRTSRAWRCRWTAA